MKGMEAWTSTYNKGKLITIDVDELDFVENKKDFEIIVEKLDGEVKRVALPKFPGSCIINLDLVTFL